MVRSQEIDESNNKRASFAARHVAWCCDIFSAIVAPGAFAVLRSYNVLNANEIAGAVVNRSLAPINISGFVVGLVLLLSSFLLLRKSALLSSLVETVSLLILTLATGIGQWVIATRLHALRLGLNVPLDQLPAADSRRIAFDTLHGHSVKALGIAMIAALIGFITIAYRARADAK